VHRPPYIPKPILKVLAQERTANAVLEERILRQLMEQAIGNEIRGMKTATLIVFGTQDRVISVETAHLLEGLSPDPNLVFVENAGHAATFEKPRQCANGYRAFRDALKIKVI